MNHIVLKGNIGRDPKVVETSGGKKIVNFSFAFNGTVKGKDTEVIWFECVAFDWAAESVIRLKLAKGSRVIVSGKLGVNQWVNKDGQKVTNPKITLYSVDLLAKIDRDPADESQGFVYESTEPGGIPNLDDIPF